MNTDELQLLNEKYMKDFNSALKVYESEYSHDELINLLQNGTVAEKQTAVLCLDNIWSTREAEILMNNLTGCDGKIREAVSFRLKEFTKQSPEFYVDFADIFLDAIVDINGNICRNTIDALTCMKEQADFVDEFCSKLTDRAKILALKAKDFDIQEGKYKINKEIFKLYWYLQTVYVFSEFINQNALHEILENSMLVKDYTIREKTAKILSKEASPVFDDIRLKLKQDENYYVIKALG